MTVFWHHVGDQLSLRDFPKTIGSKKIGLRSFGIRDIEDEIETSGVIEDAEIAKNFSRIGESRFQIWGVPTGAKSVLKNMKTGDTLMLLNTDQEWGSFEYVGRVLYLLPGQHWKLSGRLWGEAKFSVILLLVGQLIKYPWPQFVKDLRYGGGIKGMGRMHSIGKAALKSSKFGDEGVLLSQLEKEYGVF